MNPIVTQPTTTNPTPTGTPDGNLPAALDKLHTAIAAINDPIKGWINGAVMLAPSLYEQLVGDLPARAGESRTRGGTSVPPIYLDALDLRATIDTTVQQWLPEISAAAGTPERLRALAAARWRPQDADRLERIAADLHGWCASIRYLLDPEHVKELSEPCPRCGRRWIYRYNNASETVRQAALQIVASVGCTCRGCGAHWPPDQYLFLLKLLGLDAPAGVVADPD